MAVKGAPSFESIGTATVPGAPSFESIGIEPKQRPVGRPSEEFHGYQVEADNLVARFGKKVANSYAEIGETIISSPLSPIGIPERETQAYRQQAMTELEQSGFRGNRAQAEQLIKSRAARLAATERVPKFDVEPAEGIPEKVTDVAAGLTAFISQLALTKRILPKGTPDPVIWEVQNQLGGGVPGQGMVTRQALGGIGRVPTGTAAGKIGKVGAESVLFAGITGAMGGTTEDMIISSLVPVAFNAWSFTRQKQHLRSYERRLKQNALNSYEGRIKSGMLEPVSMAHLKADRRIIEDLVAKAKQRIYRDDAFAPAKEKWQAERQKALKMIASGKPDQVKRGNAILDFVGKAEPSRRQDIEIPTTRAGEAVESVKEAARAIRHPIKTAEAITAKGKPPVMPVEPPTAAGVPIVPQERREIQTEPERAAVAPPAEPAKAAPEVAEKKPWEMTREESRIAMMEQRAKHPTPAFSEAAKKALPAYQKPETRREVEKAWMEVFQRTDAGHKQEIKKAIEQGKPVPRHVLEEYKSEKWAQEALKAAPGVVEKAPKPQKKRKIIEPITREEKDALRKKGFTVPEILKMTPQEAREKLTKPPTKPAERKPWEMTKEEATTGEIEDIIVAARKPIPNIVEVSELKGTDGKWYRPAGFPLGVQSTGERRVVGYAYQSPEGQTYGKRGKTRQELIDRHEAQQDKAMDDFRGELEKKTPKELEQSAAFWREQVAKTERLKAPTKKAEPKKPTGTWEQEKRAELKERKAKRFKTANDKIQIERIQKQLKENVVKWKPGQGVGYRVQKRQVNRGLRILEVYPETHQAKVQYITDVGQLADFEQGRTQIVDMVDLLRDKKFDAQPPAKEPTEKQKKREALPKGWKIQKVGSKYDIYRPDGKLWGTRATRIAAIKYAQTAAAKEQEYAKAEKPEIRKGITSEQAKEPTITEPAPSPEVQQRAADEAKLQPTGTLDPSKEKDAFRIIEEHKRMEDMFRGVYKAHRNRIGEPMILDEVIYTAAQVDQAYRTVQKPVESPMEDTSLFAMPGKEKQMEAIGKKMASMKKLAARPQKVPSIGKAKNLPPPKSKTEDFIKAIAVAKAKESTRYAINGLYVDGEKLVTTDGRRLFIAKGNWGKNGLYLEPDLKKGILGKADTSGAKFPNYKDIVPEYPTREAVVIKDLETTWKHIQQAATVTTEGENGIAVILNKDGTLGFAAHSADVGHAEINVKVGGKILGGADPRFLLDAIGFHAKRGDEEIKFWFPQPNRPIYTKSADGKTQTVTMPVNIEGGPETVQKAVAEPKLQPDPTQEGEARGEAGFAGVPGRPGGKVKKPWLTAEKIDSPDPAIKDFFRRTKRFGPKTASGLLDKVKAGLRERFIKTPHIPHTAETAYIRDIIRTMPEAKRAATEEAYEEYARVLDGDGSTEALSVIGLQLYAYKIFVEDFIVEAEAGRDVPGGFSLEQLKKEKSRVDKLVSKVPSVERAYKARQELWRKVSADLAERGVISHENARNPHYVRHFVLHYMESRPYSAVGAKRKKLKEPFRAYKIRRKGTVADVSTDILEVDTHALAEIYADNAIEDAANEIAGRYGERAKFTQLAKDTNFTILVGGLKNVRRIEQLRAMIAEIRESGDKPEPEMLEELHDLDPTWPFRQRIAIGMSKLHKALGIDEVTAYDDAMWGGDGAVGFAQMNAIIRNEPDTPQAAAAAGIFKAINDRINFIKAVLGDKFITPERMAEGMGFVEWHYKRPNVFYRATTADAAKIAQMVEDAVDEVDIVVPKAMLRDALVMGAKRKGWIIPQWLAAQLDDLPVNKRSGYIVDSLSKPFTMAWKRFILMVNWIRYNLRNLIGDAERVHASGRIHAYLRSAAGVKHLWNKGQGKDKDKALKYKTIKGTVGDIFNKSREHGVVGTSLWHEMGSAHRQKIFDRFEKVKNLTGLRRATVPLKYLIKTASSVGGALQDMTQFREDILRMAVFLDALDDVDNFRAGKKTRYGKHIRHWAGTQADIEAIAREDPWRAAAKISRETLIDYGDFTPWENDVLRQGLVPFYSFMKKNAQFWPHAMIEATKEGGKGKGVAVAGTKAGWNLGKWAVRILFLYALSWLWNRRDEEAAAQDDALAPWLRSRPHLNVGDGTLWGQTALSDLTEWFNLDDIAGDLQRFEAGYITFDDLMKAIAVDTAKGPVNKLYQGLNPFLKAPVTALGYKTFPDVLKPRQFAKAWSSKAVKEAVAEPLGTDVKRFMQAHDGKITVKEALSYYFVGSMYRDTSPEELERQIKQGLKYTALKKRSPTTRRQRGKAKKGKESEHEILRARQKALKKSRGE